MLEQPKVVKESVEYPRQHPHVQKVLLFGSRARGDERERSDIDLAVIGPEICDREWARIWSYVEDEAPTLLSVDLVRWEEASEKLKESILREGVVLYERDKASTVHI